MFFNGLDNRVLFGVDGKMFGIGDLWPAREAPFSFQNRSLEPSFEGRQLREEPFLRLLRFGPAREGVKPFGNFLPVLQHGIRQAGSNAFYFL